MRPNGKRQKRGLRHTLPSIPEEDGPYTESQLDLQLKSIRLLHLRPHSKADKKTNIICNLQTYALARAPSYTALSYRWGSSDRYADIDVNGMIVPVGQNLWTFLHQMRHKRIYGPFWIDAICINQSNTGERNHQVQMMRQIYRNADSVSIWLGNQRTDWSTFLGMQYLTGRLERKDNRAQASTVALAFTVNEYWNRVWVIQEILLARYVTVRCDFMEIELSDLEHRIKDYAGDQPRLLRSPILELIQMRRTTVFSPQSLMTLVSRFRHHKSSVVHDKVYALLGVAPEEDRVFTVDYDISLESLFIQVIGHICRTLPVNWGTSGLRLFTHLNVRTSRMITETSSFRAVSDAAKDEWIWGFRNMEWPTRG